MATCPKCRSVNVDYENTPPNRHSVGIIIYHCRECGETEKRETGNEMVIGGSIDSSSFQQKIDAHYRIDDTLRERWNNVREAKVQ